MMSGELPEEVRAEAEEVSLSWPDMQREGGIPGKGNISKGTEQRGIPGWRMGRGTER